jgi:myo-inositol-1(or 4)-monophosphatase
MTVFHDIITISIIINAVFLAFFTDSINKPNYIYLEWNFMEPTLSNIKSLARSAGAILREGFKKEHNISYKGIIDLVTEADYASETFLLKEIRRHFPSNHIFTEESGEINGNKEYIWYIDPMDGTVNYSHHLPNFCVSICFASHGNLKLGAVYDPLHNEMFSAERGKGAHLNGKKIHSSQIKELSKSLLVTGFPYDVWNTKNNNFDNFLKMSKLTQGVRCHGSAVLDGCYVAAGRLDGFWELSLKPWDVAAAGLIAQEAGARVTTVDGNSDFISMPLSILIAAPGIYDQLLTALKSKKRKTMVN